MSPLEDHPRVHLVDNMNGPNPVSVTCYCKRCDQEAACFENAWWKIGTCHYIPTKPAFYGVKLAGLIEQGNPHPGGKGLFAESSFKDLGCSNCGDTLGFVCVEAPDGSVLAEGEIVLRMQLMRTRFRDYRTKDNSTGPDPELIVLKSFEMAFEVSSDAFESSTEDMAKSTDTQHKPSPRVTTVSQTSESHVIPNDSIEALKDFATRAESEINSQRKDIDRVTMMVGRIEQDMQIFRTFMDETRYEMSSKATTANFQANLQQMGDGIWREIHSLRAQRQNGINPPHQNSDDTVKFTVEEVDALTDSISKINQKASEVDGLRMEIQFMKNRLKRLEDSSRIPGQEGPPINDMRQVTAPHPNQARADDGHRKRPAETSNIHTSNKRPKNLDESTVMATYNIVHPPSGHTVVHPNSPHGQHLQQYTQQLSGGARPGHMNLGRPPPNQPGPNNQGFQSPYVGPYNQPSSVHNQYSQPGHQFSSQPPPMQSASAQSQPRMSQQNRPTQSTPQPLYHQHTQVIPPSQPIQPQSFSPRLYTPHVRKFSEPSTDQPRRPRGRPRKDGTLPGTPRMSEPSPSDPPSNGIQGSEQVQHNYESQRPTLPPPASLPPFEAPVGAFSMNSIERPTWLQNSASSSSLGSFQSGTFMTANIAKKSSLIDENGRRLTKNGKLDGRAQNGKGLGEWRSKQMAEKAKSASSASPDASSKSAGEGENEVNEVDDAVGREVDRQVMQSIESNRVAKEGLVTEDRTAEERGLNAEYPVKHER